MKSIVRKVTGEDWRAYVVRLMREEGVIEPDQDTTDEAIRRCDKGRNYAGLGIMPSRTPYPLISPFNRPLPCWNGSA